MKIRIRILVLYTLLASLGVFFLFPFYWVLISSLKSPAGLTMSPPAWYPAQNRTETVTLNTTGRLYQGNERTWFLLAESGDLIAGYTSPGAYYLRMDGEGPSSFVAWLPEGAVEPVSGDAELVFENLPVNRLEGGGEAVVFARMVRKENDAFNELLFTIPAGRADAAFASIQVIKNPRHETVREFKARWKNYPETLKGPEASFGSESNSGFLLFMRNSFIISVLAVLGQVVASSLVAYGFARLHFKGREFLFILLLATLMIPAQVTLIPLFSIYKSIGWVNTFLPLIVPHFTGGAFNIFLIRQYMLTIPRALDEVAEIDGCSHFQTYLYVILPNCTPVLILVALFTFIGTWQDVMGPLIYLDDPSLRTVTLGLEFFRSPYVDNRHLIMTGSVLAMLPVALVFLILQRYIMAGIATTGIKG